MGLAEVMCTDPKQNLAPGGSVPRPTTNARSGISKAALRPSGVSVILGAVQRLCDVPYPGPVGHRRDS
jgi:hypothetical protein